MHRAAYARVYVLQVCLCVYTEYYVCVVFTSIVRANRLTSEKTSACSGEKTQNAFPSVRTF